MPRITVPLLAILASGFLCAFNAACSRSGKAEASAARQPAPPMVAVAKVTREDLSHALVLTAEFKPFQEVDLMAKVAGYVRNINVDVGDRVKQGQLLAVLEVPEMQDDLARSQASLDRSQSEVARARDELQRAESAHEMSHLAFTRLADVAKTKAGLVAQQEIDDAHGKDLVAEAQIAGATSSLAAARQQVQMSSAELQKVRTLIDYTRVTAPFAGVITKRFADTGSMLQAGTSSNTQALPLVRLSQNELLRLILPVPESAVPAVHPGQRVEVRVPALGRSFPGKVARFAAKVSLATRTMDTEVDVPNPLLVVIPGMYAEVRLSLDSRPAVVTVPVTAVDVGTDESSGQVAVVTPEGRVDLRKVKLGLQTTTRIEVASGLAEGDLVVVGSRAGLQPGQDVRTRLTVMSPAP